MSEKKQEVTEVIVKPSVCWNLEIVSNNISDWLYQILDTDSEICRVKKSELSLNPFRYWEETINWTVEISRDPSVQFSEKWVKEGYWGVAEKKEVSWVCDLVFWKDFEKYRLMDMDWIIELDNWNFLINEYGKYKPNLSFICKSPEVIFTAESKETFNLPEWSFSVVYWDFFTSKKWTKCFRILPKEKAKHILICDDWGWAFNKYRWRTLPEESALYYRRASSNGWWAWSDYGVYPKDWKYILSEEDI